MQDDKVSILDDAIEYFRSLEKRIRELEAQRDITNVETRAKSSPQDMVERTSDHYSNKINNGKKSVVKKRKICDMEKTNSDALKVSSTNDVTITMNDNDVVIEITCSPRAGRLMEIMEALNSLNIDFKSVQSTEADGHLYLTIKSKVSTWICFLFYTFMYFIEHGQLLSACLEIHLPESILGRSLFE